MVEGIKLSPERAADEARQCLGVGDTARLDDILLLIEEGAGIPIVVARMPGGPDGVYTRARGLPFILINSSDSAPVRQRFTLAHELGHHWLNHGEVWDQVIRRNDKRPQEKAANDFAGEFLVPRAAIDWWFEKQGDPDINLETLVRFAHYFRASCEVALYRLKNTSKLTNQRRINEFIGAIAAQEHLQLHQRLGLTNITDSVVLASRQSVRVPQKMRANIIWALSQGRINEALAATRLRLTQEQLAAEMSQEAAELENDGDKDSVVASRG